MGYKLGGGENEASYQMWDSCVLFLALAVL